MKNKQKSAEILDELLAALDTVCVPKRNDNGYWPIKGSHDDFSTRNPGLGYFLEMDKKRYS